ncbi:hypothetical protein [Methylobacterium sp. A54F]
MLLPALIVLTLAVPRLGAELDAARTRAAAGVAALEALAAAPPAGMPRFLAEARAVSNWRGEAAASLRPGALALAVRFAANDPAFVARCVKLNNYWCIKRARWTGEIGADAEGHTAFATAANGADAAALLLRRYYRGFGRRTALAVVRRWAPAECGPARGTGAAPVSTALAPRGIGGTLRARYLARHRPGGAPRRMAGAPGRAGALRVQPWSRLAQGGPRARSRPLAPLPPLKPVPDVVARLSPEPLAARPEPKPSRGAADPAALLDRRTPAPRTLVVESAALPAIAAGLPLLPLTMPPPLLCAGDEVRIANYAARIAGSVGARPGDDLALFLPDGRPGPNLAPVLLAMSSVELGTFAATPALVEAAIARLAERPMEDPTAEARR